MAGKYIGAFIIIYHFSKEEAVAIIRIKKGVGTTSSGAKTIPVANGNYDIIYPINADIKVKKFIQTRLRQKAFSKENFLNKRQILNNIFNTKWVKV